MGTMKVEQDWVESIQFIIYNLHKQLLFDCEHAIRWCRKGAVGLWGCSFCAQLKVLSTRIVMQCVHESDVTYRVGPMHLVRSFCINVNIILLQNSIEKV